MVSAAIAAGWVLLALAPPRRPFAVGVLSFLLTVALNELPFLGFCYVLATTLLAVSQGGAGAPGGWAAAGLAVLATAGLAVIARRGLQAGPAVSGALDEGLGAGWRGAVDPELAPRRSRLPLARILLAPLSFRRRDVERLANISYGPAGRKNQLDIYRCRSRPPGAPVLVHLHGGALFMGKKNRESLALLYRLASQGWVCISANYRLSPAARFPDHLIDVKKVIAWVREIGPEYGADPAVLFLAGSSAGAQLAALAALTPGDPAYQPGFEDADTSVSAAVCLYGYYGHPAARDPAPDSPLACDPAAAPPFFVAHGDRDTLIPVAAARLFVEHLRAASAHPVVYAELPGAQHGFDRFNSLRFEAVVNGIEAFAAWVRSSRAGAAAEPARYDAAR
jgi:acetyl esterase/lipase